MTRYDAPPTWLQRHRNMDYAPFLSIRHKRIPAPNTDHTLCKDVCGQDHRRLATDLLSALEYLAWLLSIDFRKLYDPDVRVLFPRPIAVDLVPKMLKGTSVNLSR